MVIRSCYLSGLSASFSLDDVDLNGPASSGQASGVPVFGQPAASLSEPVPALSQTPAAYYLRMTLVDKPGALAKVAAVLGESGISINRMRQYDHDGENAPVLIVTHRTARDALDTALAAIEGTGVVVTTPVAIRIEEV